MILKTANLETVSDYNNIMTLSVYHSAGSSSFGWKLFL